MTASTAQSGWDAYALELRQHNLESEDLESAEIDYKRGFTDALEQNGRP